MPLAKVAWPPTHQRRQHLPGLVGVVVDRLLAQEHQVGSLLARERLEHLGDAQRLGAAVMLHQDRPVGAHGQRLAQRVLGLGRANRNGDDLGGDALLLEPDRLLEGDLVERVHRHLDVVEFDLPSRPA